MTSKAMQMVLSRVWSVQEVSWGKEDLRDGGTTD